MLSKYCSDIAKKYGIKVGDANKLVRNLGNKPFHPPTDYVFPKLKVEIYYVCAKNIGLKRSRGFIIMKSNFFVFFYLLLHNFL